MSRICPHCAYARKADDRAPDWQCPACEKAYSKTGRDLPPAGIRIRAAPAPRRDSLGKWMLLLAVLGAALWFGRPHWHKASVPAAPQPEVVLYATDWCGYCKATRAFFAANGIRYTEHDIEKSSAALGEHRKLGGNGVPLIVVDGEVIHGYNEQRLQTLLRPWLRG